MIRDNTVALQIFKTYVCTAISQVFKKWLYTVEGQATLWFYAISWTGDKGLTIEFGKKIC